MEGSRLDVGADQREEEEVHLEEDAAAHEDPNREVVVRYVLRGEHPRRAHELRDQRGLAPGAHEKEKTQGLWNERPGLSAGAKTPMLRSFVAGGD